MTNYDTLEQIPCGNGFTYRLHGRPYVCSSRCLWCREFGVYADTERCAECEERAAGVAAEERERCAAVADQKGAAVLEVMTEYPGLDWLQEKARHMAQAATWIAAAIRARGEEQETE